MTDDLDFLEQNGDTEEANIKAGVAALKRDKEGMIAALEEALNENAIARIPESVSRI